MFAHYFPPYPLSLDNKDPAVDYYERNYLKPLGESGAHAAYGGLLRDRPFSRMPLLGDYQALDLETEVRQAKTAGLDGFIVDVLSLTSANWTRAVKLMEAAQRVDPTFKVMIEPDMTALQNLDPATLAAGMAKLASYPSAMKLDDGRVVISPFKAEAKTAQWWADWIALMKSQHGITVAFVPTFLNWQANATAFAPISYGFSMWGGRNPQSVASTASNAIKADSMGKLWLGPVAVQDERPNQGIFDEAGNTETLRKSWEGTISGDAEWAFVPTWNDYSEGTAINPSRYHGWSYLDISAYYSTWWKTGAAPKIVRDGVYLTHRKHAWQAKPTFAQTKLMALRANTTPARDTVEALTFLTAPAQVSLTVGGTVHTWDAPAGVSARTVPLGTGAVSARVTRAGQTTAQVASPVAVTATPEVQDLQYVATSSLRPTS
jgi:hypothetical protein